MAFNMFPFTNLHNLNTDWILKTIKELKTAAEQAASTVAGYAARLTGLEDSVVKFTPQSLTAGQKTQARSNIGAVSEADAAGSVKYNAQQQLTTEQQATARGNIGAAPAVGVVYYNTAQSLSDAYKTLARNNIGAAAAGDVPTIEGVVRYDESQSLTDGQKTQARSNIGAAAASAIPDVTDVIRYSTQSLTDGQKTQARANIGAAASSAIPDVSDVIRYSSQSLTTPQKQQARDNIGAMSSEVNLPLEVKISYENSAYTMDQDMDDILLYIESGVPVVITCVDVSSWPSFSSFTNLRNVSISQLHVIRSGSSNDFDIVGDALLSFDETTRELQILHLNLSILSGITSIYPTLWGMIGAPLATTMDAGKWLKVNANGYPVWAALPVYQGGVS